MFFQNDDESYKIIDLYLNSRFLGTEQEIPHKYLSIIILDCYLCIWKVSSANIFRM